MIEIFGGHLWNLFLAIRDFARHKDDYDPARSYDRCWSMHLSHCLHKFKSDDEKLQRMVSYLRLLAEEGFAPVHGDASTDEVCAFLAQEHVVEVVTRDSLVPGVPQSAWPGKRCVGSFLGLFTSLNSSIYL